MRRLVTLALILVRFCTAKCPMGTLQGPANDECYIYKSQQQFWFMAEEYCIQKGGHLASVPNFLSNEFIREIANNVCGTEYWLGGGWNTQASNKWIWTDGSPFQYTHWASGKHSHFYLVPYLQRVFRIRTNKKNTYR